MSTPTRPIPLQGSEAPAKPKSSRKWIFAGALAFVTVAAASGGAWYFLRPAPADSPPKAATAKPPVFLNLEPFTVNLQEENGDHYLQAGIVFQVADAAVIDHAKAHLPVLRNRILLLLSAKRPSELASVEGKNKLVAELIAAARESIPGTAPDKGVSGALLASFVIQ
jgi:flagellar FliL protein